MVNTDEFIKRLEIILDYYSLNASTFADKIGVQRSSMSHLLSGRNKPSLDFILKIIDVFPEVDLYWILKGNGSFPKINEEPISKKDIVSEDLKDSTTTPSNLEILPLDLFSEIKNPVETNVSETQKKENTTLPKTSNSDDLEKIVFFYKNGTFKVYSPN
ncbi:helix-turn-helix transcriptional regulator [Flavobacterium sp. ZT3R18]|uniref:helix-turn-helix transcriptional regulator n=1 Tax=Flavobacterium sp. ZT3R18 TaxID=2594429 RepID=UPI00117B33BA|nr:helix-turn-helix transcriptional regulator [Flavobacterium sp. ZT3R18]TRX30855.1 helix-turn-helix transcriptional regulator [Flavobacterium sp. ZT3R18]